MYKPGKKQLRLDPLQSLPNLSDLRNLLRQADRAKSYTVELPWRSQKTSTAYSLTVRVEFHGGDPVWTLYEGLGSDSHVVWSSRVGDVELLYDVLSLSLPSESEAGRLPAALTATQTLNTFKLPEPETVPGSSGPAQAEVPDVKQNPEPMPQQLPVHPQPLPPGYQAYPQPWPPGSSYPPGYGAPTIPSYSHPTTPSYPYTQPMVPGYDKAASPSTTPAAALLGAITPDSDLLKKRPNILIGHFLIEAGLIPEPTLNAALQLQEMVKEGTLTPQQAAEAVRRAHSRGGQFDQDIFLANPQEKAGKEARQIAPPLGEILVGAGLISIEALKAALNLQEVVRGGALTKEEAVEAFIKEHFGAGKGGSASEEKRAIELLRQAGLLNEQDMQAAEAVRNKHGGEVAKILAAAGKMDSITYEAAKTCVNLIGEERLKLEQAIIALHYCQRSRISFEEAVQELGWEKP